MANGGAGGGGVQVIFTIAANTAAALAQLKAFQDSLKGLANTMPKLASSAAGFDTAVGKITASAKTLKDEMKNVFSSINAFTGALGKTQVALAKMASNSSTINKSFGSINRSLGNLQKQAANTSSALSSAGKKSTTAANNFAKLGTTLSPVTKGIQSLRGSLQTLDQWTGKAVSGVQNVSKSFVVMGMEVDALDASIRTTTAGIAKLQAQVQNLGNAAKTFTMFGGAARSASSNINNTTVSISNMGGVASSVFGSTRNAVQNLLGPITRLGAVAFTINMLAFNFRLLANSAKTVASFFLEATAQIQDANVVYKVLLGTTAAATARLEELQKINVKSPFDLPDLIQADRMLQVAGVRSKEFLENILNAALVTRPAFRTLGEQLNQLSLAISRVAAKNYGYAFRRLRELQVATQPMLEGEGLKFDRNGRYLGTVDQALKGLNNIFQKRYAQAADMATNTLHGQMSNLRDQITILRVIGGQPLGEAVLGEIKNLVAYLQSPEIKKASARFGIYLAEGFKMAVSAFHAAKDGITAAVTGIISFLDGVTGGTKRFVAATIAAFKPLGMALNALFSGDFSQAASYAATFLANLAALFAHAITGLARQMGIGGNNVIVAFASGLIRGAATSVAAAIRFITKLIASFLQGHSPPEKGPLSTIDTWFGKVIDSYLAGWDQADWSVLNDITGRIADAFQTLVDQGQMSIQDAINAVTGQGGGTGLNQLVAQAIDAIARTGQQDQAALMRIQALLGKKNEDLFKEIKARLDSAVLGKQIRALQKQLELINDTAEMQAIEQSITDAQELIKNARTARGQRAGQEQLAAATSAQKQRQQQAALMERQIKLLEEQQSLLQDQVSAYEAINQLRQTEEKFLQHMLDLQKEEQDEIKKRADAEWDYNFSLADSTKKLEMLRAKLKTVEKGSVEYWDILKQIADLEKDRADAQWEFNFGMADSAKKIDMLREKQSKYAKGSVEWLALEGQIVDLQKEQQEAQDKLNFSQQDTIQQLGTLRQRQAQYTKGSKEWLDLEQQILDATQALADAQEKYDLSMADSAQQVDILRTKQSKYTKGSVEWLALEEDINALLNEQQDAQDKINFSQEDSIQQLGTLQQRQAKYTKGSKEWLDLEAQIIDATKQLADAQWEYDYASTDSVGKLAMLQQKQAQYTQGSKEWLDVQKQIDDLNKQRLELEQQIALSQADSSQKIAILLDQQKQYAEGSIEYLNIQKDINELAKSQTDAEWNLAFAKADTAKQIDMINEKIAATTVGSAEYYALSGQLYDLEKQRADETARRADAELQYQLAIANSTQKRALLEDRLAKLNPDDPKQVAEYFQIKTELAALDKERNDAEENYNFELADSAGKIDILQKKLAGLPEKSTEWYAVQLQIKQLQNEQAEKDRKDEQERLKAEQDYQLSLMDTEQQISFLLDQRDKMKKGSVEYYEIQGRIHELEKTAAEETKALEQAKLDYLFKQMTPEEQLKTLQEQRDEMERHGLGNTIAYYDLLGKIYDLEQQIGEEEPLGNAQTISGTGSAYKGFVDNALTPTQQALKDARNDFKNLWAELTNGEGPLAEIRKEFDKLSGNPSVIAVKDMAVAFADLGQTIKTHAKDILAIIVALTVLAKTFALLSFFIGPLNTIIGGFIKLNLLVKEGATVWQVAKAIIMPFIAFLGGPGALIIGAIAAAVALFTFAWIKNWGNIREKTAAVLAFLQPELKNLGEAFEKLGKAFGRLWTAYGPFLIKVFNLLLQLAGPVIILTIGALINILAGVVDLLAVLVNGLAAFWEALNGTRERMMTIIGIFGDAAKAVGDLATTIWDNFLKNSGWDTINKAIGIFINKLIALWQKLFDTLVGHSIIPDLINAIIEYFTGLPGKLKAALNKLYDDITGKITDLKNDALDTISKFIGDQGKGGIIGKFYELKNDATDLIEKLVGGENRGGIVGKFYQLKADAWDAFQKLVGSEHAAGVLGRINELKEGLIGPRGLITVLIGARGVGGIIGIFWGMVDVITGKAGAVDELKRLLNETWTAIKNATIGPDGLVTSLIGSKEGKNGVIGAFWSIFDAVTNVFGSDDNGNSTVRGFIAGAWNGVINFINSVAGKVRASFLDPIKAVVNGMAGFMDGFAGVIKNGFLGALGVIKAFAKAFVGAINMVSTWLLGKNVIDWSDDSIKVELSDPEKTKIPDLPAYAKGTGFHPGGYALVGEEGPEVLKLPLGSRVAPNNLAKRFLQGAGGMTGDKTKDDTYDPNDPNTTPPGFDPIAYFLDHVGGGIRRTIERIKMGAEGMLDSVLGLSGIELPGAMKAWGETIFGVIKDMGIDKIGDMIRSWITDHLPGWVASWLYGKTNMDSQHRRFANDARPSDVSIPGGDSSAPIVVSPEGYVFPVRGYRGVIDTHWHSQTYPGYRGAADIFGAPGSDILAMHAGRVTYSGFDQTGGNAVFIVGSDGLSYYYAHMKNQPAVRVGQEVAAGTFLGNLWNSGNASTTSPHLHIGIGHRILLGSGPEGGAGEHGFDATSLLQKVYNFSITVPAQPQPQHGDNDGAPWWGSRNIGAATSQVTQWVKTALGVGGFPPDWITAMTMLVMGESGGDQYAINLNDVNRFHPSRGIAQVIPDTFNSFKRNIARAFSGPQAYGGEAYEHSAAVGDIYDPIENLLAALGWILRGKRLASPKQLEGYLSGITGGPWVGYASGGVIREPIVGRGLRTGTNYTFGEVGPELILPINEQLAALIKGVAKGTNMGPQTMWQNSMQLTQPLSGSMQDFSALLNVYAPNIQVQGAGMGPQEAAAVMEGVLAKDRANFYTEAARRIKQRKQGR